MAVTASAFCARAGRRDASPLDEAAALIGAAPIEDSALWATAMHAGLRLGELGALDWSAVDVSGGSSGRTDRAIRRPASLSQSRTGRSPIRTKTTAFSDAEAGAVTRPGGSVRLPD